MCERHFLGGPKGPPFFFYDSSNGLAAAGVSRSVTVSVAREPAVDQHSDGSLLGGRAEP